MFYKNMMVFMMLFLFFGVPARWASAEQADTLKQKEAGNYQLEMEEIIETKIAATEDPGLRMSRQEKRHIRKRYEQFKNMPPEKQEFLKRRWKAFKNLSPEEQVKIQMRHERFMNMTPDQREKLLRLRERWQKLSTQDREAWRRRRKAEQDEKLKAKNERKIGSKVLDQEAVK
jgi:hypothetical protein